jgi:predicted MFS family arabinose efflux permease
MKISRLFQPKNPLFWILVALNLVSLALSHIAQNYQLNTLGTWVIGVSALLNAAVSALLAWRLVNS